MKKMKWNAKCVCLATLCMFSVASTSLVVASPEAKMTVEPKEVLDVQANGTFSVNVTVTDVSELFGWQFNLSFNPAVLNVENVAEGLFLRQAGTTLFTNKTDNTSGYLLVSTSFMVPYPAHGVNGSGVLGSIILKVMSQGSSTLHFEKTSTKLRTVTAGNIVSIDFETEDGSFRNNAPGLALPYEVIAGVVIIVIVGGGVGLIYLKRRRGQTKIVLGSRV